MCVCVWDFRKQPVTQYWRKWGSRRSPARHTSDAKRQRERERERERERAHLFFYPYTARSTVPHTPTHHIHLVLGPVHLTQVHKGASQQPPLLTTRAWSQVRRGVCGWAEHVVVTVSRYLGMWRGEAWSYIVSHQHYCQRAEAIVIVFPPPIDKIKQSCAGCIAVREVWTVKKNHWLLLHHLHLLLLSFSSWYCYTSCLRDAGTTLQNVSQWCKVFYRCFLWDCLPPFDLPCTHVNIIIRVAGVSKIDGHMLFLPGS